MRHQNLVTRLMLLLLVATLLAACQPKPAQVAITQDTATPPATVVPEDTEASVEPPTATPVPPTPTQAAPTDTPTPSPTPVPTDTPTPEVTPEGFSCRPRSICGRTRI